MEKAQPPSLSGCSDCTLRVCSALLWASGAPFPDEAFLGHLCTSPQVSAFGFLLRFAGENLIYQKWIRCSPWIYMTFFPQGEHSSGLAMLWKCFLFTAISEQQSCPGLPEGDPTPSISSSPLMPEPFNISLNVPNLLGNSCCLLVFLRMFSRDGTELIYSVKTK